MDVGELRLADLHSYVERTFRHVAESKGVDFAIEMDPHLPKYLLTDAKRLQQVIKNLLSNAFKFTHHGRVALTVRAGPRGLEPGQRRASTGRPSVVAFSVSDTGIGIPPDKQQIIFEAFQQADGSTSRKYGGTGLGLAISREISRLLGGEIRLTSTPGQRQHLHALPAAGLRRRRSRPRKPAPTPTPPAALPGRPSPSPRPPAARAAEAPEPGQRGRRRPRRRSSPGDRVLLIVENDLNFARFMLETAREKGFKGLVTSLGAAALAMTRDYKPDAVTLDICLPDIDGWRVLERLKNDVNTRHIPVCVISTEEARERGLKLGAMAVVSKPIQTKEVLERTLDAVRAVRVAAGEGPAGGRRRRRPAPASCDAVGDGGRPRRRGGRRPGGAGGAAPRPARRRGPATRTCPTRRPPRWPRRSRGTRRWPTCR